MVVLLSALLATRRARCNKGYLLTGSAIKPFIVAEQKLTKPDLVESSSLETRAGLKIQRKTAFAFQMISASRS